MTPLDDFARPAQLAVLILALLVLAARVAWAVWRSMYDERQARLHALCDTHWVADEPTAVRMIESLRRPYDWRHEMLHDWLERQHLTPEA